MSDQTLAIIHAEILDEFDFHNANELCRDAAVTLADLVSMVEEGILEPRGTEPEMWQFTLRDFNRTRIIARLQHDLGINLPGAALIVELLESGFRR
jgi:chaperone modulatory protein CbpM